MNEQQQTAADPAAPAPAMNVKQNETVNYEVSKAVRHIINPQGKIDRLSVAVLIDNVTKTTTTQDGQTQTSTEPRKPEEMKKYRDLIVAAVGFNEQRGDLLTVENISFETETAPVASTPTLIERQAPIILTGLRFLIVPIIFVLAYLLFLRPMQKAIFGPPALERTAATIARLPEVARHGLQTPLTVRELEAQLSGAALPAQSGQQQQAALPPPPGPSKVDLIRERIIQHAQQDPETVAKLVRVWLNGDKDR